ncbi:MAG: asparagine--tRNA ligase [bacterium]|nr:asparagine--tRNA ligase [bacterium]MCS7309601.1 asparagine--tRNA ligase [Armatimonadota bacterium]MDW8104221.1 asparagine--tRNA ligase [Armatimonadota bacterium]
MVPFVRVKDALRAPVGSQMTVNGWVRTRRDVGKISFAEVNDGSCLRNIQVVIEDGVVSQEELSHITTGACISVQGTLVESPAPGQPVELKAHSIAILGTADAATYPLSKKRHSFEYLREIAHLRLRSNTFGAMFRIRNTLSFAIHKFFQERGFIYVHTPIITTSDCEGAGAMFGVTTLDLMNLPRTPNGAIDYSQDFFGKPAFLTVSGQLEAEAFALAFTNVYTFGPTFRAENSNTPRHLAEFWMVEPEMAFCDLDGNRQIAEEFLKYLIATVLDECHEDLELFNKWIDNTVFSTLEHVLHSPFEHITYTEAIRLLQESGQNFEYPPRWGADIQTEHERYLTETLFKRPVVVTDYPKEIKAFYMRLNDDEKTVRAMDVLVPRIGEIIGGSQREERYDVLLRRIREMGLDERNYWWYLDLRRYGSAPHSGFGLGFERMMMFVTGMKNIRDVIPFPRTPGNAEF